MIGLFLGDTDFSQIVLSKIKKLKKKYFIIDFSKNSKFKKNIYSHRISIGKFGKILNLIGLRRKKYDNKKIMALDKAYKEIFSSENLHENLSRINGEYKDNELVTEVIKFIEKDKKRPICSFQK